MRLIDADALEKLSVKFEVHDGATFIELGSVRRAPTIEAEPVRHGRWKGEGMGDYSCSLCTEFVSGNDYNYCPNCGAKMDKPANT